jgi:integrase
MKRKPPVYEYKSVFAKDIGDYLKLRQERGFGCLSEPYTLKTVDNHLCQLTSVHNPITPEIVDSWIQSMTSNHNTKIGQISRFKQFAQYLCSLGHTVYIPDVPKRKRAYIPHIFTTDELQRLFEASDNLPAKHGATYAPIQFPVLIRIIYGCGLRAGEALALQIKDINWEEKTILIRNAKGNKDRLVPMSDSVLAVCKSYFDSFHSSPVPEDYFIHNKFKQQYPGVWAYMWMRKTLETANIDRLQESKNSRGIALHCLRHTFAVNSFSQQSENGIERYYAIPILSTFLGHDDIYGTEQYLRLTAEQHTQVVGLAANYTDSIFAEVEL